MEREKSICSNVLFLCCCESAWLTEIVIEMQSQQCLRVRISWELSRATELPTLCIRIRWGKSVSSPRQSEFHDLCCLSRVLRTAILSGSAQSQISGACRLKEANRDSFLDANESGVDRGERNLPGVPVDTVSSIRPEVSTPYCARGFRISSASPAFLHECVLRTTVVLPSTV